MAVIRVQQIHTLDLPELAPYRTLRRPLEHQQQGIFVAEGTKVVERLLESKFAVINALMPEKWLVQFEPLLRARPEPEITVYVAEKELVEQLVGFPMFQGVLAIGRIPVPETLDSVLAKSTPPRLFVAIDALTNAENVGTIVRNSMAFGAQALLVGETCCSPFLRRAVRSSMGAIFQLPVVEVNDLAAALRELARRGFRTVAAHPHATDRPLPKADFKGDCCIVFGSEGYGIRPEVLEACTDAAAIPMQGGVDSLNVCAAAAVFLYEVARQRGLWAVSAASPATGPDTEQDHQF
ncbi:MAG: RNA methyltransferase [Verrucomicrobiae bacterium]|nr:RNA methyltransferase [Verrucomicrobiae bacterium]